MALLWLAAPGCVWLTDGELARYGDLDGDGSPGAPWGADCDDGDPLVSPANQLDPRGGRVTLYADTDEDGYGDTATAVETCTALGGHVPVDGDCDDSESAVGNTRQQYVDADGDGFGVDPASSGSCTADPGFALERGDCNDADDGENPDATWFVDLDGDGFGAEPGWVCAPPPLAQHLLVSVGSDCDDRDPVVWPGAEDPPLDGLDQDCAGDTDLDADGDSWPDFPPGADCPDVNIQRIDVASETELAAALGVTEGCLRLVMAPGEYPGGWHVSVPTVVTTSGEGVVQFVPPAEGTVPWGFTASAPLTVDRVRFAGFTEGAVRITSGASLWMGDVVLEGGVGVVGASSIGGGAGSPPELRLLGMKADATGSLVDLPFPVGHAELVRVSSRGAVSLEPLVRLTGDELTLRSVEITGCAVISNVIALDPKPGLLFEDVLVTGCLIDGGVTIAGEAQPDSTRITNLRIEDTVFLTGFRDRVALEVQGAATIDGLRLQGDVIEERIGLLTTSLVTVGPDTTIEGLWISDIEFPSDGVLVSARPGEFDVGGGGSVSLSDAVLAISPGGAGRVSVIETGGIPVSIADSTIVDEGGNLTPAGVDLGLEVVRSLFVGPPPRSPTGLAFADSGFAGGLPPACPDLTQPCCRSGCRAIGDPGFLRYDDHLDPALWDLRFTVGSTDADCPRDASEADARGVGALRTSSARASLWYPDGDRDGLLDDWELRFLGPIRLYGADGDPDGDRLTNACEQDGKGTLPDRIDTDLDDADDRADGAPLDPDLQ
jgi:hypothetical protein